MNKQLVLRYIEVSTVLLSPITPHISDHIWSNLLKKQGNVITAGWPAAAEPDFVMQRAAQYIEDIIPSMRKLIAKVEAPPKKKKGAAAVETPTPKVTHGQVWVSKKFVGWQEAVLLTLQGTYDAASNSFAPDTAAAVLEAVRAAGAAEGANEKQLKQLAMPFAKYKMDEALKGGAQVLDVKLPFDEAQLLQDNLPYLLRSLNLDDLSVGDAADAGAAGQAKAAGINLSGACPGQPVILFSTAARSS
eukprot:GHRR01021486.1.p1 GENE.GHRR01021486.1~~GHRR01021486.1.p1  ORF type:complete len:246 (+),score=120.66 GHRR01021486.1:1280-2017(+)